MNTLGIDIGGTFTDLVGHVDGTIVTSKASTVPGELTRGVATSLDLAGCQAGCLHEILHGSTIAINTVLENKGARTALLTTRGFRDVYAIGRSNRVEAFNLFFRRPKPLVPRDLTFEIPERMLANGTVAIPLDMAALESVLPMLDARGVEAVAVCFLHSYSNPEHERRAGEFLRRVRPALFVTLSHEILREYREYERTSTTVLNAFVGPRVRGYLRQLEVHLHDGGFRGKLHLMRSNGGVMSLSHAQQEPVSMMESGPVAGMIGAGRLAKLMGFQRCVGFDMGGTTAKASMITDGVPAIEMGYVVGDRASGQPMQLPVVDIVEVGAGGGSIAWVDETGALHVGPQSVGADPGPACYGHGSDHPVVTDADLLLGRINPKRFLNGAMLLDKAAAERALRSRIAGPLGLDLVVAASGVVKIADAAMSLAVRAVSVSKGVDPRDTALIAFGGAGPLHATAIAREIYIPQVVIPKLPGTFSALGMLMASWRQDFVQTLIGRIGALSSTDVEAAFGHLAASGREKLTRDGIAAETASFRFFADLRYLGQEHSIPIPVETTDMLTRNTAELRGRFHREHDRRYGQSAPSELLEMLSLRLVVTALRGDMMAQQWLSEAWSAEGESTIDTRPVVFDDPGRPVETRIYWRPSLPAGTVIIGPAVIEEPNSTTLIHPGDRVEVTHAGHLVITLQNKA